MTEEWLPRSAEDLFGLDPADPPRFAARSASPLGVTVVIPTCRPAAGPQGSAIHATLPYLIADAARAGLPFTVLVAADGLRSHELEVLRKLLERLDCGWELTEVDPAEGDGPASAARTRNHALARLAELRASHRFRQRYLLFLDDDSTLSPGGLGAMVSALEARPDAVAACPRVTPVESVSMWAARAAIAAGRAGGNTAEDAAPPSALPGPWYQGRYDLLSVTSHGSLVSGRVVGLLARADPVLAWLEGGGRMFCPFTPRGSGEDMLAGAALAALGTVLGVPAATAGDEWRATPSATREQQLRWGYDHAWMVRALSHLDLLAEGVRALEWRPAENSWYQSDTAHPAGPRGVLIDPPRLRVLSGMLTAAASDPESARAVAGADAPRLGEAAAAFARLLEWWRRTPPAVDVSQRIDLPERIPEDWAQLRDGLDSRLAHVAGNALGSLAGGLDGEGLPTYLLYGLRQRALGRVRVRPAGVTTTMGMP